MSSKTTKDIHSKILFDKVVMNYYESALYEPYGTTAEELASIRASMERIMEEYNLIVDK